MKLGCCRSLQCYHIAFVSTDCESKFTPLSARNWFSQCYFLVTKRMNALRKSKSSCYTASYQRKKISEQRVAFGDALVVQSSVRKVHTVREETVNDVSGSADSDDRPETFERTWDHCLPAHPGGDTGAFICAWAAYCCLRFPRKEP